MRCDLRLACPWRITCLAPSSCQTKFFSKSNSLGTVDTHTQTPAQRTSKSPVCGFQKNLRRPVERVSVYRVQRIRGFEKGLAGGGWQPRAPRTQQNWYPRILFFYSWGAHRKKGAEKRPESMACKGFPCANPLCPPTPFRNL